jgi:hypothetical protein
VNCRDVGRLFLLVNCKGCVALGILGGMQQATNTHRILVWNTSDKRLLVMRLHDVAHLVEALRYEPEGRGFDGFIVMFIDIIFPASLWPWVRLGL